METYGAEATIYFRPSQSLTLELSGVYQKTRDLHFDIDASYSPGMLAYFKAVYHPSRNFTFSVSGRYIGAMEPYYDPTPIYSDDGEFTGDYTGRTSETVDPYLNIDANISVSNIVTDGTFLNLHVTNLLDTEYYYPTLSINNAWADRGTLGNGRRYMLTMGYHF